MPAPRMIGPARLLREPLAESSRDFMRAMLGDIISAQLSEYADVVVGAAWRQRPPERTMQRTRVPVPAPGHWVGTIDLAIPRLHESPSIPDWLLERGGRPSPP